jgi:pimeloyl-ACP methyl ester carboxylesterase
VTGTAALLAVLALAGAASGGAGVPRWNHWLCMPGTADDWCSVDLTTDVFYANGAHRTIPYSVASDPEIDCFYVYPTVSEEMRGNATLTVEPAERQTAIDQAARFSHVCRVYAPLYRQVTAYGNGDPYHGNYAYEWDDVLAAWRDYMAHYNDGRGVYLIGHSEGAFLLEELISRELEGTPAQKQLVGAILLGGNVVVRNGSTVGGDFKQVPICTHTAEAGCVTAYSSWGHTPPGTAMFQTVHSSSDHVVCVNPAAPGSSKAVPIDTVFAGINPQGIASWLSSYVSYHWVEFPDLYEARCVRQGHRAWLLVTRIRHPGDKRPEVQQVLGANWGFHAADMNLTLGNLVSLVQSQERTWLAHR